VDLVGIQVPGNDFTGVDTEHGKVGLATRSESTCPRLRSRSAEPNEQSRGLQAAADKMNLKLEFQKAATPDEIDDAFQAFASQGVGALLVTADPLFNNRRAQVLSLVASHSLPAIYQWRGVTTGGLMSYGPSITEAYHHAGVLAGLILKGAKPADLPVVQPAKFQLLINLWTARQLGLTVPQI
jgi:putative ABC transport system substrate-binding protein